MGALSNARHERFAQELAKGKSATEAYAEAGYEESRSAASRLSANVNIQARVAELQERAAVRTEITMERLTDMLLADRELARQNAQAGAAVSATEKLGKLHGFFVERTENLNYNHDVSDRPASEEEWAAEHTAH